MPRSECWRPLPGWGRAPRGGDCRATIVAGARGRLHDHRFGRRRRSRSGRFAPSGAGQGRPAGQRDAGDGSAGRPGRPAGYARRGPAVALIVLLPGLTTLAAILRPGAAFGRCTRGAGGDGRRRPRLHPPAPQPGRGDTRVVGQDSDSARRPSESPLTTARTPWGTLGARTGGSPARGDRRRSFSPAVPGRQ